MKTNLYKLVSFYIFIGLLAVSCQNQDEMFSIRLPKHLSLESYP